jgi:hypothetical protein
MPACSENPAYCATPGLGSTARAGNREQDATGRFERDELAQRVDHLHVPLRSIWPPEAVCLMQNRRWQTTDLLPPR